MRVDLNNRFDQLKKD